MDLDILLGVIILCSTRIYAEFNSVLKIVPNFETIKVGDTVTFQCLKKTNTATGVDWKHRPAGGQRTIRIYSSVVQSFQNNYEDDFSVGTNMSFGVFSLVIKNVKAKYAGTYFCVDNDKDSKEATAELVVIESINTSSSFPNDVEVVLGDKAELVCNMDSNSPLPNMVYWKQIKIGDTELSTVNINGIMAADYKERFNNSKDKTTGIFTLTISSTQPEDAGTYVCFYNQATGAKATTELVVIAHPPTCQSNSNPTEILTDNNCGLEPDNIHLSCATSYYGNVAPGMSWVDLDGKTLPGKTKTTIASGKARTLHHTAVVSAKYRQNGIGFVCKTANSKPDHVCQFAILNPLYIFNYEHAFVSKSSTSFSCPVNSSSTACEYAWYHNEKNVASGQQINFENLDPGIYKCEAKCLIREKYCSTISKVVLPFKQLDNEIYHADESPNWWKILFAITCSILGIVIVIALICIGYCCFLKQRKSNRDPIPDQGSSTGSTCSADHLIVKQKHKV
jgi:hypothetical protein